MRQVIRLKLILEFDDIETVDVNDCYRPTVSKADANGKRHGFLRSSYELMAFQDKFDEMLKQYKEQADKFIEDCKSQYEYLGFKVTFLIGLPRTSLFYIRKTDDLRPHDASNYVKAPEDRLAVFLGIDDKYNMQTTAVKYLSDNDKWNLKIIMEPVDYMKYTEEYIKEEFINGN